MSLGNPDVFKYFLPCNIKILDLDKYSSFKFHFYTQNSVNFRLIFFPLFLLTDCFITKGLNI